MTAGRIAGAIAPILVFLAALSLLVTGWSGWGKIRRRPGAVKRRNVSRETSSDRIR